MTDDSMSKTCRDCGIQKPLSDFSPHPTSRDGYRNSCKACRVEYQRERYLADPDYHPARWRELKSTIFNHYGRACACCGATERLSIDHIEATSEGKNREHGVGSTFYLWLIREGFPGGYQVLCLPCNQSKGTASVCRLHQDFSATLDGRCCSKCGKWKPWSEFHEGKRRPSQCKPCILDSARESYRATTRQVRKTRRRGEKYIGLIF